MSFLKGVSETDGKTGRRESRLLVISEVDTLFIGAAFVACRKIVRSSSED
jgi:hypothetical protein